MRNKILVLFIIVVTFFACNSDNKQIHGLQLKGSLCTSIESDNFPSKIRFVDSLSHFSIDFPESWYTKKIIANSIQGVTATDTTYSFEEKMLVSVTHYQTAYRNLDLYFSDDIYSMQNAGSFQIHEIGKTKINDKDAFWVLYDMSAENRTDYRGLVYYVQGNQKNQFFLIETTLYGTNDLRMCESMEIVNTFRIF